MQTGVMETHDEETRKFFKHSSVTCVLAPRYGSNKLSIFKQQVVGTIYTHHQKCVIVDTQHIGNNRKITTFIGGLDLCDGRYDTPEHRLYRDLKTVFHGDYHNPTFGVTTNCSLPLSLCVNFHFITLFTICVDSLELRAQDNRGMICTAK